MDVPALAQTPGTRALLGAAVTFLILVLTRRVWLRLLGPVFVYEIVRLSRQGKTIALRGVYAALLLFVLFVIVPPTLAIDNEELDKLANEFSRAFLVVQAVAVLLLTPIYVASAVSGEKDKKSLDFLLCTPLSEREIVVGKLAALLVNVFGLILCGLPILALTQLWGGVDVVHVLAGFAVVALAALSLGSFTILCSVLAQKTVRATAAAYVAVLAANVLPFCLPYGYLLSPVALEFVSEADGFEHGPFPPGGLPFGRQMLAFATVHGVIAMICLVLAILQLRRSAGPPEPLRDPLLDLLPPPGPDGPLLTPRTWSAEPSHPPVYAKRPLVWKEAFLGRTAEGLIAVDMVWLCFALITVAAGVPLILNDPPAIGVVWPRVFLGFALLPGLILVFGVGHRLSDAVSGERVARTLESLLVLPLDRSAILGQKLFGAFRRASRPIILIILTLLIGTICRALHPLSAILLFAALLTYAAFAATFGLFLSTACGTTVRARLLLFGTFIAIGMGTWLGHWYAGGDHPSASNGPTFLFNGFNPIRSMVLLAFGPVAAPPAEWTSTVTALACGLFAYAGMALVFWFAAVYRFRREIR